MSNTSERFKHPLYAFLQPEISSASSASEGEADSLEGSSNVVPEKARNPQGDSSTRDLATILSSVHSQSRQLDNIVSHVDLLVKRVESVEILSGQSQEQVQTLVSDFKADSAKIALETGDRVNSTLRPALGSLNDSINLLAQQTEAIRSDSARQREAQNHHNLSLIKLEKDVERLSAQVEQLNTQLLSEKAANQHRLNILQEQFRISQSTLSSITLLGPLLQSFLEGQLRTSTGHSIRNKNHNDKNNSGLEQITARKVKASAHDPCTPINSIRSFSTGALSTFRSKAQEKNRRMKVSSSLATLQLLKSTSAQQVEEITGEDDAEPISTQTNAPHASQHVIAVDLQSNKKSSVCQSSNKSEADDIRKHRNLIRWSRASTQARRFEEISAPQLVENQSNRPEISQGGSINSKIEERILVTGKATSRQPSQSTQQNKTLEAKDLWNRTQSTYGTPMNQKRSESRISQPSNKRIRRKLY
ncbi:hypothetical protein O181_060413 [Austropuccinia psidii MF-1]|uniref:Uncharacterized protein n=1 Tax=Austropuccinia psidii MF-1 TaxID=1389203 RepID=A0A9Q3EGG3_9BASI|nr:hypothetical protein [Austropuccinia psidii MF-1]